MYFKLFLITGAILVLVVLGLGVQIFFSKKKKFPETHIGHNKEMQKRDIHCVKTEQKLIDKEIQNTATSEKCDSSCCG